MIRVDQPKPDFKRECLFVDTFVVSSKRDRYKSLMANPKTRPKILDLLNHKLDIDWTLATEMKIHALTDMEASIISKGMPLGDCYLISDDADLDGVTGSLFESLALAERSLWGTILDCIPGRIAFYWEERGPKSKCYLLEQKFGPK